MIDAKELYEQGVSLVIFDKDGTLAESKSGEFVNSPDDQVLLPNVREAIAALQALGIYVTIASNQGGVAFGYMKWHEATSIVHDAARKAGIDNPYSALLCPYHPDGTEEAYRGNSIFRKPAPGMIIQAMLFSGIEDGQRVLFVGDMETDKQAAERAGVRFMWAKDFFGWDEVGR